MAPISANLGQTWATLHPTLGNLTPSLTQLEPIWVPLGPTWSDLEPTWDQLGRILVQLEANLTRLGPISRQHGFNWSEIWSDRGSIHPYVHTLQHMLYNTYVPKSILHNHTSIAHRFLLHKQTRPQQYHLQSLPAALCEWTIASCPLFTVYCHQPAAHPLLPITMGGVTPIKPSHKKSDDEESFFGKV